MSKLLNVPFAFSVSLLQFRQLLRPENPHSPKTSFVGISLAQANRCTYRLLLW